ncbi:LytTR family DNA-binding domain-containing protein [Dokdonia sp.]|uniref:LytTR family DNA-binding domain-containing protein n=1 Tax=Dokdonia sp. TaxID=2024995 RepID=UPI0032679003
MRLLPLHTSYKYHVIIAGIISLWLVSFLVLIAPFDASDLSFIIRLQILPFYGVISFIGYMVLIPIQNKVFTTMNRWTLISEIIFISTFNILVLIGSYGYYKTGIINGDYSFSKFSLEVFTPIFFILLPILIFLRWFLNRKAPTKPVTKITLTGENKLDILQIYITDLISVSSADNYIEVSYLKDNLLQKKLLRNTLKNIHEETPSLLKVHRSHLINPIHFKEWKSTSLLGLTHVEVPVSKNYKQAVLDLNHSSLKTDSSSQTL